jgi:hypothetical protein
MEETDQQSQPARMLRIHISENDRYHGKPLTKPSWRSAGTEDRRGTVLRGGKAGTAIHHDLHRGCGGEPNRARRREMIDTGTMSLSDVGGSSPEGGRDDQPTGIDEGGSNGAWKFALKRVGAALRKMLEPPTGKVPVVIDTDTYNEIDDQYAVAGLSAGSHGCGGDYAAPT